VKVGDLVKCTMLPVHNEVGLVVETAPCTIRVHFIKPEEARGNPRWVSIEYVEVIDESR